MRNYEASTLKKGLQIVELLKRRRALSLKDITEELGLSKTTAFRLVTTLESMGYVKKKGKYYGLNAEVFHISIDRKSSMDWTSLLTPYELGKDIGESIYIGTLDGLELVMQQMIKYPFNEPFEEEIGNRSEAHLSALGKVILAHLNHDEQEELFDRLSLKQATEQTFVDRDLFFHHLDVIKNQGFAIDDEERMLGVRCVAAPIFHNNQVIAALAIAGPTEKIKRNSLRRLSRNVIDGSKEMEKEINAHLSS